MSSGWRLFAPLAILVLTVGGGQARAQEAERLFRCLDGSMFRVSFGKGSATLLAFGDSWMLPQVQSGSGARYSDGRVMLWKKGRSARVENGGKIAFRDCVTTGPGNDSLASAGGVVTGTATYRARLVMPPTAVLIITVEDVSLEDAPSVVLGEKRYSFKSKQVPISFKVPYDGAKVDPRGRYRVAALIEDGAQLLFVTDTRYPVITGYPNHADLVLVRVTAGP